MNFNFDFARETLLISIKAIPVTLNIVLVCFCLAFLPAFGIALARLKKIKVVSVPATVFISLNRGFPIVVQILIIFSIAPSILNLIFQKFGISIKIFDVNPIVYAYIVFTLNATATLSEVLRSALQTVSKGQYEAGICAGLSVIQTYRRIILPQAFVSAVPNICNMVTGMLKSTSLAYYMTIKDVTGAAMEQASTNYNYIEAYLDVFLIYIVLCSGTQLLFRFFEKRLNVGKNGGIKPKSYFKKFAA